MLRTGIYVQVTCHLWQLATCEKKKNQLHTNVRNSTAKRLQPNLWWITYVTTDLCKDYCVGCRALQSVVRVQSRFDCRTSTFSDSGGKNLRCKAGQIREVAQPTIRWVDFRVDLQYWQRHSNNSSNYWYYLSLQSPSGCTSVSVMGQSV